MEIKSQRKVKVLTIAGICEVFECNRQYFYANIRAHLEPHPTVERKIYYREDDVLALHKKFKTKNARDFEVVK